jgi:putative endonuclease
MRAAAFLLAKGYRIAARRWRSAAGEIDIVARRGNLLIFVEVKARSTFDDAAYLVTPRQKQRIAAAAAIWLAEHGRRQPRHALRRDPGRTAALAAPHRSRVRRSLKPYAAFNRPKN